MLLNLYPCRDPGSHLHLTTTPSSPHRLHCRFASFSLFRSATVSSYLSVTLWILQGYIPTCYGVCFGGESRKLFGSKSGHNVQVAPHSFDFFSSRFQSEVLVALKDEARALVEMKKTQIFRAWFVSFLSRKRSCAAVTNEVTRLSLPVYVPVKRGAQLGPGLMGRYSRKVKVFSVISPSVSSLWSTLKNWAVMAGVLSLC